MSPEEQKEATVEAIKELEGVREMKSLALHNVPISAFNDAKENLVNIQTQVHSVVSSQIFAYTHKLHQLKELHEHTGTEIIFIAVRGECSNFLQPFVVASPKVEEFFQATYKTSITSMSLKYEGFCISGLQGKLLS